MNDGYDAFGDAYDRVEEALGPDRVFWEWPGTIDVLLTPLPHQEGSLQLVFGLVNETINADLNRIDGANTWQYAGCGPDIGVPSNSDDPAAISAAILKAVAGFDPVEAMRVEDART